MPTEPQYLPRGGHGAGSDIRHVAAAADEQARYWIDGDAFPRLVLDVPNGRVLVGNGTAPPTPLSGGGGGGASTADHFVTYAADADLTNNKQLGTLFRADVVANRGAFGTAGQMFFATDTLVGYVDTGTAWLAVTPVLDGGAKISVTALPNHDTSLLTSGILGLARGGTSAGTQQGALDAIAGAVTNAQVLAGNGTHVTLRALVPGDIPALDFAKITTGVVPIAQGGTGATTQQAALDALAGAVTNALVLAGNGTHVTLRALAVGDLPTVDIAHGGTGQVTQQAAIDALLPAQTGNSGKVLGTNGTTSSWVAGGAGSTKSYASRTYARGAFR